MHGTSVKTDKKNLFKTYDRLTYTWRGWCMF